MDEEQTQAMWDALAKQVKISSNVLGEGDYYNTGGAGGTIGGINIASYPNWAPLVEPARPNYEELKDIMNQSAQYQKMMEALKQAMEQQQMRQHKAQRSMSKAEMMRGILAEITTMRERMDAIVAQLATEALTGDPEPSAAGAGAANQGALSPTSGGLAGLKQLLTGP